MAHYVDVKLPRTKLTSMIVYPNDATDTVFKLQSERRMVSVDVVSGKMVYSKSGAQYSNFMSLMKLRGAKTIDAPTELIEQLKALKPTGKTVTL